MTQEEQAQVTQLQQQQSLLTQALVAALEGRWQGENSVEAYLYAISPDLQGHLTLNIPVVSS